MAILIVERQPKRYTSGPFTVGHKAWEGATVGQVIPLDAEEVVVGRAPDALQSNHPNAAVVYLPFPPINRYHARFRRHARSYDLEDMQSRNGTYVNGVRIGTVALNDGDRIQITEFEFVFRVGDMGSAETNNTAEKGTPASSIMVERQR
jgi:pSer/pThr/pTyr-binding forkhead associated (FHA) protein